MTHPKGEGPYRGVDRSPPPSYVVALTRWGRPLEEELEWITGLLGGPPHELRRRLGGPIPVVLGTTTDTGAAASLRLSMRERGHGAVVCDLSRVASSRAMVCPRDFELTERAFVALAPAGPTELAYAEIGGIVWAKRAVTTVERTVTTKTVFSSGAALLTGGLVTSRRKTTTNVAESTDVESIVYLFRSSGERHVLLAEGTLRYGGLGATRAPTMAQNFRLVVDALRTRAPSAVFDARLATSPARPVGSASTVDPTDLAAHLVLIARLQDQV